MWTWQNGSWIKWTATRPTCSILRAVCHMPLPARLLFSWPQKSWWTFWVDVQNAQSRKQEWTCRRFGLGGRLSLTRYTPRRQTVAMALLAIRLRVYHSKKLQRVFMRQSLIAFLKSQFYVQHALSGFAQFCTCCTTAELILHMLNIPCPGVP